jgi:hypothetical protein
MQRYLAIHEAGHVVVADALGFTPSFVRDAGEQLEVAISMPPADARTPHEDYVGAAIAFAGMLAQTKYGEPPDCGSTTDLQLAVDHAIACVGQENLSPDDPKSSIDPVLHRASKLAGDLVEARWSLIVKIADLIERCEGNVSADQLADVLSVNARRGLGRDEQPVRPGHPQPLQER